MLTLDQNGPNDNNNYYYSCSANDSNKGYGWHPLAVVGLQRHHRRRRHHHHQKQQKKKEKGMGWR
jgi:hypothetical protein